MRLTDLANQANDMSVLAEKMFVEKPLLKWFSFHRSMRICLSESSPGLFRIPTASDQGRLEPPGPEMKFYP